MSKSDLSHIVTQMKTQATTTLGWDVVVNYNEEELNDLLAIAYHDSEDPKTSIKEFKCSLIATNEEGDDYTIRYKFLFGVPLLKFIATYTKPVCSLIIPILGGTAETDKSSQTIGDGVYSLSLNNLELASAQGGESCLVPTPADKPFVFPPAIEADGVVFINFAASKDLYIDIAFTGPDKCPKGSQDPGCVGRASFIDNHMGNLKDKIRYIFTKEYTNIRYELARVSSKRPVNGIQLVPKSFMFATYTPNETPTDEKDTILTLFIQTRDTNYGMQSGLNLSWNHLWTQTLDCPPIPSGKTASIILDKGMVFTTMIEPAMKEQNYSCQINDTKGYVQLQVFTGEKVNEPEDKTERWIGPLKSIFTQTIRHNPIYVVLSPLLLVIEQSDSNNGSCCRGTWTYEYTFNWSTHTDRYNDMPEKNRHGTVTVENTLNKAFPAIGLADDYTMKIRFLIEKDDWNVETKPHDPTFWDELGGGVKETPRWVKNMNVHIPAIDFNMGSLDFFLTTNLLLPSREVIDIDKNLGVQVPNDFFIIGNVKKIRKRS
ncbi:hypothetical protein Clacol_007942 [Clathrus columnatus]|uniref:Uncharacterized protein n=1 Tax=Clathrus columnatus TaxID=1419009 RepID=A0AAV5AMN5_9AGAM|nr:hypothetical protein Clacol_007942 [Clathrus columnatus]